MKSDLNFCSIFWRLFDTPVVFVRMCIMVFVLGICGSVPVASAEDDVAPQQKHLPEVRVGELSFKVTSLRLSEESTYNFNSWATISMTITNHGNVPIALDYVWGRTSLVNERGYTWHDNGERAVSGLPVETIGRAGLTYTVDPHGELRATIPLNYSGNQGQTAGSIFSLSTEFSSWKNLGEGKAKKLRIYPVSFVGLHKAMAQSDKDQEKSIPEEHVGELSFKLESMHVSEDRFYGQSNATITIMISNHGKEPIALDYEWGKSSFVNEHGYAWHDDGDRGVSGLPVARGDIASVDTVIAPDSAQRVTIPLSYTFKNNNQTAGNSFDFEAEFSAWERTGEGQVTKRRTYPVSFTGAHKSLPQAEVSKGTQNGSPDSAAASASQPKELPEVRVGDLGFKLDSLEIVEDRNIRLSSLATISMKITNYGKSAIALDYALRKSSFVNELGYAWRDDNDRTVSGLPVADGNSAGVNTVISPGSSQSVSIPLVYKFENHNQVSGSTFDFSAEFSSWQDMGEGVVKKLRTYPVSFIGLHQSSGVSQGLQNLGDALKKGFGSFFGK